MSVEQDKPIVRRDAEEILNQGNLDVADEIFATNFVNHDPSRPEVRDVSSYKQLATAVRAAFPDFHVTIEVIRVCLSFPLSWLGACHPEGSGMAVAAEAVKS